MVMPDPNPPQRLGFYSGPRARPPMAEHTYVKYITLDGISQASPEGAAFTDTITLAGLHIVKSVISPITEADKKGAGA